MVPLSPVLCRAFLLPTKKPPGPESRGLGALTGGAAWAHAGFARDSGCDSTTSILRDAIKYQNGTDSPPIHRPQGGLAMAGIRAHPGQKIPSLTSRGRQLTGGVEALFRDSHDYGRVGRRYGTRMKTMTTDLYLSLPSLRVPSRGGQKRRLVLWGNG